MKLKPITPAERALGVIDTAMRELTLIRQELASQVPRRKPQPMTHLRDPRNGEMLKIGKGGSEQKP
jgi:hypothetical protein